MNKFRFLTFLLLIGTLVLSACGAVAATPNTGSGNAGALPVAFIGIVDSIIGDQWVIGGTTLTVDPAVVQDGPFAVGDQVKVEGVVNTDGSFTVSRVEAPTPQDVSTLPQLGNDNSNEANANDNVNDANVNDDNSNANFNDNGTNTNDDNGNGGNTNDDNKGGGNSNDDSDNDDNGGGGNSNDDNHNDDNGGGGNSGKGGGDDDKGGNSNDDD